MTSSRLLSWRLRAGGRPLPIQAAKAYQWDVVDELGVVEITGSASGLFRSSGAPFEIRLDRTVRVEIARVDQRALWVMNLAAGEDGRGDLVPFEPLRMIDLDGEATISVPGALQSALEKERLAVGDDLVRAGTVEVGDRRVAVLGQPLVATLDAGDDETITWWLPSGTALVLRLTGVGQDASLTLAQVIPPAQTRDAPCGPNTLVHLGAGSRFVLEDGNGTPTPGPVVAALTTHRSGAVDAWARYAVIERMERQDAQERRGQHPLDFIEGHASGASWTATVHIDDESARAWIGADVREGRWVRVGQPVGLTNAEERFDLTEMVLRGPGVAELRLKGVGDTRRLPPTGRLEARENVGEKIKNNRERAALERLGQGRAGLRELASLLASPDAARRPRRAALPYPPEEDLDRHQREAVELILGVQDIVAIQGPPGTGKTRVIAEALRQLAKSRTPGQPPLRVLISSVQNEAVGNVVERLANTEGLLVRVVQRQARSEDESLDFADRAERGRERVIESLGRRLAGSDVSARLRVVDEAVREILGLRRLRFAEEEPTLPRTRERLGALAGSLDLLSLILRDDALRLAAEAPVDPAEPPDAPSEADLEIPVPATPEDAPAWWGRAAGGWPGSSRAEVGSLVSQLVEALAIENPLRRKRRVDKTWVSLQEHLHLTSAPPGPTEALEPSESAPEPEPERVDGFDRWIARALFHMAGHRAELKRSPEAIAFGFLSDLEADAHAWKAILDRHGGVVAATCSMAATARDDEEEFFDLVIIDEAGRASPFELLIPLVQGARVVLIGDHRQLPPMIDDAIVRLAAQRGQLISGLSDETLFASVFERLPTANKTRLGTQYRMHEAIGDLVDQVFYRPHKQPLSSYFAGPRAIEKAPVWGAFGDAPLVWVDVAGPRPAATEFNGAEVEAVIDALRLYAGNPPKELAIIVPYRAQKRALEKRLGSEPSLGGIAKIRTIDSVQGREYDVVFFCTVRNDEKAGFMASENRVNVAISRARSQLVVFGSRRALGSARIGRQAPHLKQLVELIPVTAPSWRIC